MTSEEALAQAWAAHAAYDSTPHSWDAQAYRIAAAALRWYALTEEGGDDHAARQAVIAACREATR